MHRRDFLARSGAILAGGAVAAPPFLWQRRLQGCTPRALPLGARPGDQADLNDWKAVREQFELDPDLIHMASFYLVSHPRPVREAIERHRRGLDANPIDYLHHHTGEATDRVLAGLARYLNVQPADIALTDSTTMGLGLVYSSIALRPDDEVLSTEHDHYSTNRSLDLRAERTGASIRRVRLYEPGGGASTDQIVSSIQKAITDKTRVLAVTWVHSSSGVKLPLRAIADMLAQVNAKRQEQDRVIFCVDGVHGLGIEDVTLPELGCDVFIAGTHKWLFGPRGTGLIWARPQVQAAIPATIPPFPHIDRWNITPEEFQRLWTWGMGMTPGGFHSFENRWAVAEAVEFHEAIGKSRVAERVHTLNRQLKEGLAQMKHVRMHTPMSEELSAGIVCFEVGRMRPGQVVSRLAEHKIVASVSPYQVQYARLAPSLLNNEEQVETCLRAVRELA